MARIGWQLLGLLLALRLGSGIVLADNDSRRFPDYSDAETAALWLFDELLDPSVPPPSHVTPLYYTQTITDASRNYYDLQRLHGGAIEDGRFGRSLRVRGSQVAPGMQYAANFASEPRVYGVFLPADHEFVPGSEKEKESVANFFWYTVRPDHFVDALESNEWTVELWLRLADADRDAMCIVDSGQGPRTTMRLEFLHGGKSYRIAIPATNISAEGQLADATLADGDWHHFALVKSADSADLCAFVDGKLASKVAVDFQDKKPPSATSPGLVARPFSSLDFDNPQAVHIASNLQDDLKSISQDAKSVRLRGWIRAPYTGEVRFDTDSKSGMHLDVDHRPLTYGWFGRAAIYRRSPRWGVVNMRKGELYPVLIEMQQGEGDLALNDQQVYWSWPGGPKQLVPASEWLHTEQDVDEAERDEGGGFQPQALIKTRYNLVLGSDREGRDAIDGWLDEVRVSSVARYAGDFTPTTHSFNYGSDAPPEAKPTGPPLLFAAEPPGGVYPLGSRRHLFIDDVLVEDHDGVQFVVNPPVDPQTLEPELPFGDHSFFELDGNVALFAPAGYEGREDYAYLWISDDGVHFRLHDALSPKNSGEKPQAIKTDVAAWGRMALDNNPDTPAWARFKYTAGVPHRGIYLLVSPDAIHWRRNETIMLQVGTGGESHWYWDDQTGEYRYLLKWDHGPGGRQSVEATTRQCFQPWPLKTGGDPKKDLSTPSGYMPSRFPPDDVLGEVYRSRGVKYPWAPDAYVAFVWRFDRATQARQVELAISRDGTRWTHFGDEWYMPAEFPYAGQQIHEVTSVDGMVRRGDQIWQYADYSTGRHDGSLPRWRVRLTQRLDGFVSLDAGSEGGEFVTKPLTFDGDSLALNVAVKNSGDVRVAMLDSDGKPFPGFSLDDCVPIRADGTDVKVAWKSNANLRDLAGEPVRLLFRMNDAKLYAMQFE